MTKARATTLLVIALALVAGRSWAGPPFLTDDPQPVDYKHWEAYAFGTVDAAAGGTDGQFPAFEFNWGALPELQLHVIVPETVSSPSDGPRAWGFGDVQVGFKLRLVRESGTTPQIGIFPIATLPTGSASRGLGNGALAVQLPVWLQKSWGPWTTYGGAGVAINRSRDGRNCAFGGWLLQRDFSEQLTLGGELFATGASSDSTPATAIANLGGQVNFSKHASLLFSVGHSFAGARHRVAYLALYLTGGPEAP